MSLPTTTSPAPAPQPSEPEFDFLTWLEVNRTLLLIALAVVCAGVVGFMVVRARHQAAELEAAKELLTLMPPAGPGETAPAVDAQKLLQLGQQFAGTPAGQQAKLLAASQLFVDGKFAEAQATFAGFEEKYADSPFLGIALLGVAASLDAQNKSAEAITAYDRVIGSFGNDAPGQQARLAKARLLQGTQPKLALGLIEDVLKNNQATGYSDAAAMARAQLLAKHPELDQPQVMTNATIVTPAANATAVPAAK